MRTPLFGLGLQGKSPAVTAKKMQNLYAEIRPIGENSQIVAYGTPGLELFVNFGDTPARGGIYFAPNDVFFIVHRGTLWEVNNAGTTTSRGTINTTSGRVSLAHNGTQICLVDGTDGWIWNTGTSTFSQIVAAGFPSSPQTVTFNDSYFIVNKGGTQQFNISGVNDGTAWSASDYSTADSNPDDLTAVTAAGGQLILLGPLSGEFWGDTGALNFPYVRIPGSTMEWGLAAQWSLAKFDNTVAGLFKGRMGQVMVAKIAGYVPQKISTPDMDAVINGYVNSGTTVSDASAFSYMVNGHPMYQINFPSVPASWLYDGLTGFWSPLKSAGIARHRAEWGFNYINYTLVADYSNGKIYKLKDTTYTDNGDMIEREIIGEHIATPDEDRIPIDLIRLEMETGVGLATGQGSNPQAMLQVSRDGGQSWGPELWTTIGKIGERETVVEWRRPAGTARRHTFKVRISDPVKVCITAAAVNPQD